MIEPTETLAKHWLEKVHSYRGTSKVALRQKDFGIWQSLTWDESYLQVRDFSLGLVSMGLKRGDRVAIIGDNDREYLWAAFGVMAAGGAVVGLFTDVTPPEAAYVVEHCDAAFVVAGDQEQCDKLLDVQSDLPLVKKVIYWDNRGMWGYDDPWLMDFRDVQGQWDPSLGDPDEHFEAMIEAGMGSDPAMFCYTSGTTGLPKGAIISHSNFVYAVQAFGEIDPLRDTDDHVSFLPLAWIAGAALDISPHVVNGVILNFAESPETVRENIREIAPDQLLYNSRLWETLVATIRARILDSNWLNRTLYDLFLPIGYRAAEFEFQHKEVPLGWRALRWIGNRAVFRPLLSQFGLHKARDAYTTGAALSPDVIRFFRALGLPLRQIYGSTEVTGGALLHRREDVKFASVGEPIPGSHCAISEEGEILLSGPGLFHGYHKDSDQTNAALYVDSQNTSWFRTGDAGHIDEDGHLIYLDRLKDMIELSSGEKYSPQFIEGRLKFSPYISHALTLGDARHDYVAAIITVDFENVGRWAEKQGVPYTTLTDLSQKPEVYELIRKDVEEMNRTLPESGRVRKFVLLHKEFDPDEGEMTRTRKLRRGFLFERYSEVIDSLYSGERELQISDVVKYQDGREGKIDSTLRIESLENGAA
ncbi:MAG: AMP-binding protein [Anaerolineales bacterium]